MPKQHRLLETVTAPNTQQKFQPIHLQNNKIYLQFFHSTLKFMNNFYGDLLGDHWFKINKNKTLPSGMDHMNQILST